MFFAIKNSSFNQSEKRKQDELYAKQMEQSLQRGLEKKREEEMRAATELVIPRSRIATPGIRRMGTSMTPVGQLRAKSTPRRSDASTPASSTPRTPRSRLGL
jgi:hypothetical protein